MLADHLHERGQAARFGSSLAFSRACRWSRSLRATTHKSCVGTPQATWRSRFSKPSACIGRPEIHFLKIATRVPGFRNSLGRLLFYMLHARCHTAPRCARPYLPDHGLTRGIHRGTFSL
jgi:hypothetical protein